MWRSCYRICYYPRRQIITASHLGGEQLASRVSSGTYVSHVPKLPYDLAVVVNDLLLNLEPYLAAHLWGVCDAALIYHG